ncbi:uncharacterized protein G2W53_001318 [Senna tora]|uniref:Uncharacterized protein n=1 Tax=Senna tora TaxID=362788 RepID=A0A834XGZ2_9FABA|nr:uncharacterized protein G2W53_001318 [Senna tora]
MLLSSGADAPLLEMHKTTVERQEQAFRYPLGVTQKSCELPMKMETLLFQKSLVEIYFQHQAKVVLFATMPKVKTFSAFFKRYRSCSAYLGLLAPQVIGAAIHPSATNSSFNPLKKTPSKQCSGQFFTLAALLANSIFLNNSEPVSLFRPVLLEVTSNVNAASCCVRASIRVSEVGGFCVSELVSEAGFSHHG